VAKGRRPSRSKKHPPVLSSSAEARQEAASAKAADRAETDELAERLIALRSEVSEARAGAEARSKSTTRGRFRRGAGEVVDPGSDVFLGGVADVVEKDPRRRWLAALIAVLAAVAVLLGLIVAGSTSGSKSTHTDPVAAYLDSHVSAVNTIAVIGNNSSLVPTGFDTVQVDVPTSAVFTYDKYIVGPYPPSSAGAMSSFLAQNTKKLAVSSNGTVALYELQSISTSKPTTPSTAPVTTHVTTPTTHVTTPVATVPATTSPPTVSVTTVPVTTPVTTAPPATSATTTPTTSVTTPGGAGSGQTTPNGSGSTSTSTSGSSSGGSGSSATGTGSSGTSAGTLVVAPGSSFWTIAQAQVQHQLGTTPTVAQVGHYWAQLVAANVHNLPRPGDPNLIYAGQTIVLPAA
jgi:uncharacterized membrane protein YgcG